MKQTVFDSYGIMTEEEKKELLLIQRIKNNVKYFLDSKDILTEIIKLIDDSKYFKFNNERNRKFINKKKPMFILTLKEEEILKDNIDLIFLKNDCNDFIINNKTNEKYENDINWIQSEVYNQIIRPYNDYLETFLLDNNKFKEILVKNGLNEITLDNSLLNLITMSCKVMFSIKVDLKNNRIYLEYAI